MLSVLAEVLREEFGTVNDQQMSRQQALAAAAIVTDELARRGVRLVATKSVGVHVRVHGHIDASGVKLPRSAWRYA